MHPQYNCECRTCGKKFRRSPSIVASGGGKYCSRPCQGAGVRASNARNIVARFRSRLADTGACLEWTGGKTMAGYGLFCTEGNRHVLAHRFAYELAYGPIPDGLHVCHACDNPSCCRPEHLWLGTDADNAADKIAKGRDKRGDEHGMRRNPERAAHGEAHVCAKLREVDVVAIRARHAAGDIRIQALANEYGVTYGAIKSVITRRNWKHVA